MIIAVLSGPIGFTKREKTINAAGERPDWPDGSQAARLGNFVQGQILWAPGPIREQFRGIKPETQLVSGAIPTNPQETGALFWPLRNRFFAYVREIRIIQPHAVNHVAMFSTSSSGLLKPEMKRRDTNFKAL